MNLSVPGDLVVMKKWLLVLVVVKFRFHYNGSNESPLALIRRAITHLSIFTLRTQTQLKLYEKTTMANYKT